MRAVSTGRAAVDEAAAIDVDVLVVDWLLPDMEGIELVSELRTRRITPGVLFLAPEDATERMLQRLGGQNHDYVVRPFSRAEIVARTEAIFRRAGSGLPGEVLQFEDIVVDVARHEVFRGERRIPLPDASSRCSATSCSTRGSCSRSGRSSRTSGSPTRAPARTSSRRT